MPTERAVISAVVLDNKIYVIGGVDPNLTNYDANEVYDPSTDTWEVKAKLPTPRAFVSTAAVNGIIYAIGGGWPTVTAEVDAYDPVADTWTRRADLLGPRFGASAGVVDGIIYNVGGNHYESNCEAYDPNTDEWKRLTDIPGTEGGLMVCPYNGLLYAFGGGFQIPYSTVCAYDPGTDKWTRKADMPTPRATSQACLVNGKIYVLGGYSQVNGDVLSDLEVYDPSSDRWEKKPDMPFKRTMFGAAVVNGKIYVIGGHSDWGWAHGYEVWEYDPAFHTAIAAGSVSGTWTSAQSPYYVDGEITIPDDSTLMIEPGVEVVFTGHYKLNVQGRLLAVGTPEDTIRFTAQQTEAGWHGIRFHQTPGTNDTSRIAYCSFRHGKANTGGWSSLDRSGGAILISEFDKVVVSDCLFEANLNSGEMYETGGAAVFIRQASPIVTRSTFRGNTGTSDFAIKCVYASTAVISRNIISHSTGEWGAIICEHTSENRPLVSGNLISHNVSRQGAGGIGFYRISNARIENNIIVHNSGVSGGILCSACGSPTFLNNTIAYNSASYGGGGVACRATSNPILINNIIYGNSAPLGPEVGIEDGSSDPVFLYCDILGGKEGFGGGGAGASYSGLYENNVDADPQFANAASGDYRLKDSSPCIGAGIDSVEVGGYWYHAPLLSDTGLPRPSPPGSRPDIGALENPLGTTGVGTPADALPASVALEQNYPNPFNPATVVGYRLPVTSEVKLAVYDLLGREVRVLVDAKKEPGVHRVTFDASGLTSGVYLCRLKAGGYVETRRLMLLK